MSRRARCERQPLALRAANNSVTTARGTSDKPYSRSVVFTLHVEFAFCGVMVVLLGAILPRLTAQLSINDAQAGLLMMTQFVASAAGALLVRRHLWQVLRRGYWLQAMAALGVVLAPPRLLPLFFGLLGLSLGLLMTTTTLLIGRISAVRRGSALAILNVYWSLGAVLGPAVISRLPSTVNSRYTYIPAVILCLFAALTLYRNMQDLPPTASPASPAARPLLRLIAYSSAVAFLYVGVESALGNWITTYLHRDMASSFERSNLSLGCFWAALLIGRLFTPLILRAIREATLCAAASAVSAAAVVSLLFAHSALLFLLEVCVAGLALAPLYPLILSAFLARAGDTPHAGWVFTMAGCGGGILSWLTGEVSTRIGSLRWGLLVPAIAAVLLLLFTALRRGYESPPTLAQSNGLHSEPL